MSRPFLLPRTGHPTRILPPPESAGNGSEARPLPTGFEAAPGGSVAAAKNALRISRHQPLLLLPSEAVTGKPQAPIRDESHPAIPRPNILRLGQQPRSFFLCCGAI